MPVIRTTLDACPAYELAEPLDLHIGTTGEEIIIVQVGHPEGRKITIENRKGDVQLLIYGADTDTPVVVRLPPYGGIIVDTEDYDTEVACREDEDN